MSKILLDVAEIEMGQSPPGVSCNKDSRGLPLLNGPTEFGPDHPFPTQFTTDAKRRSLSGDLLFCVRGSTTGRMNWADQEYAIGRGIAAIRPKKGAIESLIRAVIENQLPRLLTSATGSTFPNVSRSQLEQLEWTTIPEKDWETVAHILSTLDDKIALNRKLNATLEAMAQALFQSWFVDFDPVKAKLAAVRCGRDPGQAAMAAIACKLVVPPGKPKAETLDAQLPSTEAIDAAIAALNDLSEAQRQSLKEKAAHFPADFQESELGLIPQGWEVKQIESILELSYGKGLKKTERISGIVPVYGSGGVNGYHNKPLVAGPGIIVGRKGTIGSLYWEPSDFFPIDTVFYIKPKENYSLSWIYYLMGYLALADMNTDAAVPGLNRKNVYRLEVTYGSVDLVRQFSNCIDEMRGSMDCFNYQSRTLAELRDALLPKLLSGEISVSPN